MAALTLAANHAVAQVNLGNIMPLGDSITVGDGSPGTPGGYRDPLYTLLTDASYTFSYVGSQTTNPTALLSAAGETEQVGHAGATIAPVSIAYGGIDDDLQTSVATWIPDADPNYILLMIGTNNVDLSYPTNLENGPYDPSLLAEAGADLATLINTISNKQTGLAPDAHLIVSNIIWIGIPAENVGVQQYNAEVLSDVQTAQAQGENVSFYDMYDQVPQTLDDKSDNLHPNAYGYQLMAQGWYSAIQAVQSQPNVVNPGSSLAISASTDLASNETVFNNGTVSVVGGTDSAPIAVGNFVGSGSLAVGSGGTVGSLQLSSNGGASTVGSLTISTGSTMDITNNAVFINYGSAADPISTISSYLASGAIVSSTVASLNATPGNPTFGIGYADGADGVVNGLSSGQIEILPTLAGDARLQGIVNFGDFQILLTHFGATSAAWDEGNWRVQTASATTPSVVNFGDFRLLLVNFGQESGAGLNSFAERFGYQVVSDPGGEGLSLVVVPEPASIGLLLLASSGLLARRRRRR
jgi:lysophospholipase L1-like esterase